ncbi:NA+/H+ antiporter (napA), putative [hydrothermal vent metagenome]|uniref:NA+/H+ antiporter (NapA), putative n=1 Tax=hydrothermal vent metagenome TaxID=652676 RepID=A0A1W1BG30_9ZZZZ
MENNISLILTLSLLIWISPFVSRVIRIPTPPVEILLGSVFAYLGFIGHHEYFDLVAEVGFLYLMFLAGMEVNLKQILSSSREIIRKAIIFLTLMGILSVLFGWFFNLSIIVTISLPLVSIGLLASLSKIYGKDTEWLKLAFIVGILGEIVSIAMLTTLEAASLVGFGLELFIKIIYLIAFLYSTIFLYRLLRLIFWWYPELKKTIIPNFDTADQDIRLAISLFFIMIVVMLQLGLELALGAFIAGVAISAFFHHEKGLEEKVSSFGFGILVPIFFIHVGSSFDLASLGTEGIITGALLITTLMIIIRLLSAFVLKNIYGSKNALLVAFSLSMPLTLLVAVATIGYNAELIDLLSYYQLILASLLQILISMIAIKLLSKNLN